MKNNPQIRRLQRFKYYTQNLKHAVSFLVYLCNLHNLRIILMNHLTAN